MSGFYDIAVTRIDGTADLLGGLRGKVTLAVNVASQCGLTPQYQGLEELQRELSLTYMFIAHNLNVVQHISDRVLVMYVGRMVEVAETARLFAAPRHPYTEALLSAVPIPDPTRRAERRRILLRGEVADAAFLPGGCPFHPRCSYAVAACTTEVPPLREIEPGHFVTCHRAGELDLRGI